MILDPLRPYLEAIKAGVLVAALGGAYLLGSSHASARCEQREQQAAAAAQSQALDDSAKADEAGAAREQAAIVRQAALEGARRAIKEAKPDACLDTPAPDDVLNALAPSG